MDLHTVVPGSSCFTVLHACETGHEAGIEKSNFFPGFPVIFVNPSSGRPEPARARESAPPCSRATPGLPPAYGTPTTPLPDPLAASRDLSRSSEDQQRTTVDEQARDPNHGFSKDFLKFLKIIILTRRIKVGKSILQCTQAIQGMRERPETTPRTPWRLQHAPHASNESQQLSQVSNISLKHEHFKENHRFLGIF